MCTTTTHALLGTSIRHFGGKLKVVRELLRQTRDDLEAVRRANDALERQVHALRAVVQQQRGANTVRQQQLQLELDAAQQAYAALQREHRATLQRLEDNERRHTHESNMMRNRYSKIQ